MSRMQYARYVLPCESGQHTAVRTPPTGNQPVRTRRSHSGRAPQQHSALGAPWYHEMCEQPPGCSTASRACAHGGCWMASVVQTPLVQQASAGAGKERDHCEEASAGARVRQRAGPHAPQWHGQISEHTMEDKYVLLCTCQQPLNNRGNWRGAYLTNLSTGGEEAARIQRTGRAFLLRALKNCASIAPHPLRRRSAVNTATHAQ